MCVWGEANAFSKVGACVKVRGQLEDVSSTFAEFWGLKAGLQADASYLLSHPASYPSLVKNKQLSALRLAQRLLDGRDMPSISSHCSIIRCPLLPAVFFVRMKNSNREGKTLKGNTANKCQGWAQNPRSLAPGKSTPISFSARGLVPSSRRAKRSWKRCVTLAWRWPGRCSHVQVCCRLVRLPHSLV